MRIETEHRLAFALDASRADSGMPLDGDLPGVGKRTSACRHRIKANRAIAN